MNSQHANKILAESGACTVEHCLEYHVAYVHFVRATRRAR